MIVVDYIIIAIVVVSALIGLVRGFVKEALSLGTWIVAGWLAIAFASDLAPMFAAKIESPVVRQVLAGFALFAGALIVGGLVRYVISLVVSTTGLSGTDRVLGMVFGAARGVILEALLLLMLVAVLPIKEESWWTESRFVPFLESVVGWLAGVLPPELSEYLQEGAEDAVTENE